MKVRNFLAVTLMVMGLIFAAAAVSFSFIFRNQEPILLGEAGEAQESASAFMNAVCAADFTQASESIVGQPKLGVDRESNTEVGNLIWDAYWSSTEYQLIGDCYATDTGVAQKISFTYLDMTLITGKLRERSLALLEERVASAKDTSEIYDENNEYQEDVVMDVLYDATTQILQENSERVTVELVVNLRYENGQWWIVPDEALIDTIFGGSLF